MHRSPRLRRLPIVSLFVMFLMLCLAMTASADTITVTSTLDSGVGTLRQAILDANAGDVIDFSVTTPATITLTSGELVVTKTLTIQGPGADLLAISGNDASRVIYATTPLTLTNLTVRDGNSGDDLGGGIMAESAAPLILDSVTVTDNRTGADKSGGGIMARSSVEITGSVISTNVSGENGGGMSVAGALTMTNTTVSDNEALVLGIGGGLRLGDVATIAGSRITGNSANSGGGIVCSWDPVTITHTTIDLNTAETWGGAVYSPLGLGGDVRVTDSDLTENASAEGGAFYAPDGELDLTRCSVADNRAGAMVAMTVTLESCSVTSNASGRYGAIFAQWLLATNCTIADNSSSGGQSLDPGTAGLTAWIEAYLQNCSIVSNDRTGLNAESSGGILVLSGATLLMTDTLVAENSADVGVPDIWGAVTSGGGNLVGDGTGSTGLTDGVNGDQVGTSGDPIDPLVGEAGDYGGDTETAPLLPGSPAIDMGTGPGSPASDQRGVARDGSPDVGAYEARAFGLSYVSGSDQSTAVGTPFVDPVVAQVTSGVGDPVDGGMVTFSAPSSGAGATFPNGGLGEIVGGLASITPCANGTEGAYQAEATLPGLTPVTYDLENTQTVRGPGSRWIANYARGAGGWTDFNTYPRWLADVDGDGMDDIVAFGNRAAYVSLGTGSAYDAPQEWIYLYGPAAGGWTSYDTYPRMLGDVNGDGMDDIVAFGNKATYVSLSTGSGFLAPAEWIRLYGPAAGGWNSQDTFPRMLGDVNGDGRDDIVAFGNRATYVSLSTGASFLPPGEWIGLYGPAAGGWTSYDTFPRFIDDVNGDGMGDIVAFGNKATYVSYSTGSSFGPPTPWAVGLGPAAGGWMTQDGQTRLVGDVDGDGKTDIVAFGGSATYAWKSTTGSLDLFSWFYTNDRGWTSQNLYPRDLGDATGDGKLDIVGFGSDGVYVQPAP